MTPSDVEIISRMEKLVRRAEIRKNHVPYDKATANEYLKDPQKMDIWIRKSADAHVEDTIVGWQVILSIDTFIDGASHHHGSAMLVPKGRSSDEEDWKNLGKIVARSGAPAPEGTSMPFSLSDDPNMPQHWYWFTEPVLVSPEAV